MLHCHVQLDAKWQSARAKAGAGLTYMWQPRRVSRLLNQRILLVHCFNLLHGDVLTCASISWYHTHWYNSFKRTIACANAAGLCSQVLQGHHSHDMKAWECRASCATTYHVSLDMSCW